MNLKRLGVALLAVVVLGAIMASSAYAENEFSEPGGQWYTKSGGVETKLGATLDFSEFRFLGKSSLRFNVRGIPVDITIAKGRQSTCSIVNSLSTRATLDCIGLIFEEVSISEPIICHIETTITTKKTTGFLGMNKAGTVATLKITPQEGAVLATIELTGEKCTIAGLYKMTGTIFAQAKSATGVFAKTQEFETSEAIQKAAGETTSLKVGESAAFLTSTFGATAETEWGGKEK